MAQGQKGARRRGAWVVFLDESGVSLTPVVRRTWAPVGQSPVLVHPFRWQRASMAAAVCAKVGGGGARVAFDIRPGSYTTERLIEVLGELHRFLDGDKVTLVWDNLPAHTSRAMRAWTWEQRSWLVVEYLPPYAPDLNPVETLWSNLKRQELANLASEGLGEVMAAAHRGIQRIRWPGVDPVSRTVRQLAARPSKGGSGWHASTQRSSAVTRSRWCAPATRPSPRSPRSSG